MKEKLLPRTILAIDSAVGDGSLALWRDGQALIESIGASRAEKVIVAIERVLREARLAKADLDVVAVSIGPGSYSGIRIGVATAFGLGHALDIPIIGVSVLEALARNVTDEKVIAVVPIGRNDMAWQIFETNTDGKKLGASEPFLDPISRFSESLNDHRGVPIVAPPQCTQLLSETVQGSRNVIEIDSSLASAIARLATEGDQGLTSTKPIYMRSAVAR